MLDSGSIITLGKDRSLFFKVWDLKDKVMMDTNGGSKFLSKGGEWKGYGTAYYVPDAMMNIVSLSDAIETGFQVFMDTVLNNAFCVTNKKRERSGFPAMSRDYTCWRKMLVKIKRLKGTA